MQKTLKEIASIIDGEIIGDENIIVTGICGIKEAQEGDLTFIANSRYLPLMGHTRASAIITSRDVKAASKAIIRTENPSLAFAKMVSLLAPNEVRMPKGIHPTAIISKEATVGKGVSIGAYVVIDDHANIGNNITIYPNTFIGKESHIGDDSVIYANVSIRENVIVGKRAIIHCNSVIGDDGFGYLQVKGKHKKIPQIGTVEIGDDVEIGAMVTICRAALDKTIIGNGVKIDNHSHIAHNVSIGDNTMLIAYAKIAGSTKIGKNVMIAEDVGITDHVTIGDNCIVGGGSNVYKSLEPGSVVWGSPAKPINEEKRIQVLIKKLPEMYNAIKKLIKTSR